MVSVQERERIKECADRAGRSVSSFIRLAVVDKLKTLEPKVAT